MKGIFLRAMESKQKLTIMYMNGNNEITQREVKVLKMNDEYLLVYCYFRKAVRTMKWDHILSAEPRPIRMGA